MSTVAAMERHFRRVGKVLTISADAPVTAAAERMSVNDVGCLIVLDGPNIVGICSERDIIRALSSGEAGLVTMPVRKIMTANVIFCTPDTPIEKAQRMMGAHGIRHLPIVVGDVAVGMVSSRDILDYRLYETSTKLAEAHRNARAAQEAKNEFLTNVSYEVRTPMSGIIGMTEMMLDTALTDEQREYLGVVKASADALLSSITKILDYSELAAGRVALKDAPFNLHQTVRECLAAHQDAASAKGLQMTCRIAPEVPAEVVGDAERLAQVLRNLLDNAVKFTSAGEVAVSVDNEALEDAAARVRFSVRDTGVGIRKGKEKLIFEPFSSVDGAYQRRHDGAGLGLATAARLVGLMNGRIWVDSTFGQGSTFHFTATLGLPEPVAEAGVSRQASEQ